MTANASKPLEVSSSRARLLGLFPPVRIRDRKEKQSVSTTASELPLDPSGATLSLDTLLAGRVVEHHELRSWGADGDATKP